MFVTHTKQRLGSNNYKSLNHFLKTGQVLTSSLPPCEIDTNTRRPSEHATKLKPAQKGQPTLFRKYYLRGDMPVSISFNNAQRTLKWLTDPKSIDLVRYLPLFIEGLSETEEPFTFISEQSCLQAISANGDKLVQALPEIILPLKKALDSKVSCIVIRAIKVLQAILAAKPTLAEDLVPYYKNLLPCFNKYISQNKNLGHHIEYSQKDKQNIGDLIMETLNQLEANGGPEAFAHIKYMIPVYQSTKIK